MGTLRFCFVQNLRTTIPTCKGHDPLLVIEWEKVSEKARAQKAFNSMLSVSVHMRWYFVVLKYFKEARQTEGGT